MTDLRSFLGVDPGNSGALCILDVVDAPESERHGNIVRVEVIDLPTTQRDGGGLQVDALALSTCVAALLRARPWCSNILNRQSAISAVIEWPVVGGRGRGAASTISQGVNYGLVVGVLRSNFIPVSEADPTGGRWYAEVGAAIPKGADREQHSIDVACKVIGGVDHVLLPKGTKSRGPLATGHADRADAVLLADLARRRWLGTTVVQGTHPKAAAKALRARWAAVLKQEEAIAIADLPPLKELRAACETEICPVCGAFPNGTCHNRATPHPERVYKYAANVRSRSTLDPTTPHQAFLKMCNDLYKFSTTGYIVDREKLAVAAQASGMDIAISLFRIDGKWLAEGRSATDGHSMTRLHEVPVDMLRAAISAGLVRLIILRERGKPAKPVWVTGPR